MYLITKWFGTFICNKKGIQNKILFPKNEKEIAKRLLKIDKNEILAEENKITKNIKVTVNEKRLIWIEEDLTGVIKTLEEKEVLELPTI